MYSRRESNPYQKNRNLSFYPLNYRSLHILYFYRLSCRFCGLVHFCYFCTRAPESSILSIKLRVPLGRSALSFLSGYLFHLQNYYFYLTSTLFFIKKSHLFSLSPDYKTHTPTPSHQPHPYSPSPIPSPSFRDAPGVNSIHIPCHLMLDFHDFLLTLQVLKPNLLIF